MKGPQIDGLSKKNLIELYVKDESATISSIAKRLGCHRETVRRWLMYYNLPLRGRTWQRGPRIDGAEPLADKEWLGRELSTKTQTAIAAELGINAQVVSYWARKHGLNDENKSSAIKSALNKRYPDGRYGKNASNWRGGRRKLPSGYVYVYMPDHPSATSNGVVMEHRLVMEEKLGRYLEKGEIVHHIDGDKSNNNPDNLTVKTRSQHVQEHFDALARLQDAEQRIGELEAENEQLKTELARWKTSKS